MATGEYDPGEGSADRVPIGWIFRLCVRPLQAVAFWAATVLPLSGVGMLYLEGWTPLTALLFVASAVAILVGHPHGR